jgi:hypothetical protein
MTKAIRGHVTLHTPSDPDAGGGGGGAIGPIDYLAWNGPANWLRWEIPIAAGGEYLICQAHWQPSAATPRVQAGVFWTDEGGYSLAAFQPVWIDDGGNDGVRILTQHMLSLDYGPLVPFDPPSVILHFDPFGDVSEFEGWVWHIPATSVTENLGSPPGWEAMHPYALSDEIVAAGHAWFANPGGTSGGSEPVWAGGIGGSIGDGSVTWYDNGAYP